MIQLGKDPGMQISCECSDIMSRMVDDVAFYQDRVDDLTAEAFKDCTEAVVQTDENAVIENLAAIGNRARLLSLNGDLDDKLSYVDEVCKLMDALISKHANAQSSLDLERRQGERSTPSDPFPARHRAR